MTYMLNGQQYIVVADQRPGLPGRIDRLPPAAELAEPVEQASACGVSCLQDQTSQAEACSTIY